MAAATEVEEGLSANSPLSPGNSLEEVDRTVLLMVNLVMVRPLHNTDMAQLHHLKDMALHLLRAMVLRLLRATVLLLHKVMVLLSKVTMVLPHRRMEVVVEQPCPVESRFQASSVDLSGSSENSSRMLRVLASCSNNTLYNVCFPNRPLTCSVHVLFSPI